MMVLIFVLVLVTLSCKRGEACQPELEEDAASLVTVGYDRKNTTAVYVDTLSLEMKNQKEFSALLTSSCNGRRDATVAIDMRKEGDKEEWEEMARQIKLTASSYNNLIDLDPCSRYEVRILIKSKYGREDRELPIFKVGPFHELDPSDMAIAKFKGDGEQYYSDNFRSRFMRLNNDSFTIGLGPICAVGINVFVKGKGEDWEKDLYTKIESDFNNQTKRLSFDVDFCKVYEVKLAIFIAPNGQVFEKELPFLTGIFKWHINQTENKNTTKKCKTHELNERSITYVNENIVLYISIPIAIVAVLMATILVVYLLKRKSKKREEPKMERNVYYGRDDEYYNENDNRVEDKNDYYE